MYPALLPHWTTDVALVCALGALHYSKPKPLPRTGTPLTFQEKWLVGRAWMFAVVMFLLPLTALSAIFLVIGCFWSPWGWSVADALLLCWIMRRVWQQLPGPIEEPSVRHPAVVLHLATDKRPMPRRLKDILLLLAQTTAQQTPVLNLSNGNLAGLIGEVCAMDWLVELNLAQCHLAVLPAEIGNLTRLQRLILTENQLSTLPDSITRLTALQHLNLQSYVVAFRVSEVVLAWLKTVPEVIWRDGNPLGYQPPRPYFLSPGHPNLLLDRLKGALKLHSDAFAMEERGYDGDDARQKGNAIIAETFAQTPGLREALPEFYQNFLAHDLDRLGLDENPFQLPTREDEEWRGPVGEPLRLGAEVIAGRGRVVTVTRPDGGAVEIGAYPYGAITQMNTPDEANKYSKMDCAAWLYQAGGERFYLRVEPYGHGAYPDREWLGSSDGGRSWLKQPVLTHEWLEKTRGAWLAVDHLPLRPSH